MHDRPRLLFLAQCLPYPPHSGVAARTFNILKQLRNDFDIDLLPFFHRNHQPDGDARTASRQALRAVAAFVAEPVPIPGEHFMLRKYWDHLRSLASGRAYTHYVYDSRAFAAHLRAVIRAHRPDLVHMDSLDLHRWLSDLPSVPVACTHHNIESELLRRHVPRLANPVLGRYLRLQADRIERLERELCPRFALNVTTSELDAQRLHRLAPGAATVTVPNGTDTEFFQPWGPAADSGPVVFVGPTYSYPNRDAVDFLLDEIWPTICAADPSASVRLIGRGAAADHARYETRPGVRALGHIADIRPALAQARCCVVPIRIGGGTRLKILDAWAMGKAVVSTSIGCEGLAVVDGENIVIRDQPDAFADAVLRVLHDAPFRTHLERGARRTAVGTYGWGAIGDHLRAAYATLLAPVARPSSPVHPAPMPIRRHVAFGA